MKWIDAAREARVIPIAAPFENVSVHVVDAPCVGGIGSDFRSGGTGDAGGSAVIWLANIGLAFRECVAEGKCGGGAGAAGIFPLGFGGETDMPVFWKTGGASFVSELAAEFQGVCVTDPVDGKVFADAGVEGATRIVGFAVVGAHSALPLRLSDFEFAHPETAREGDVHLSFVGAMIGFFGRTAHPEFASGTPTEFHAGDFDFVARFCSF